MASSRVPVDVVAHIPLQGVCFRVLLKSQRNATMTVTQTKPQFLTEALIEVLNNEWKVNTIESGRSVYTQLEYEVGRKYIKVWSYLMDSNFGDSRMRGRSCFMFVDKYSGAVYKPASYKAPAKHIRFWISQLAEYPEIVDPYGSFLYIS
jgi:hypothetical protein